MVRSILISVIVIITASGFSYSKKKPKLPEEYVYIPAGTMSAGPADEDVYDGGIARRISIPGFYLSKYEITNLQYREFYTAVSPGLSEAELEIIAVDSTGWRQPFYHNELPLVNYFHNPAFNNYPVVNIRYEAAQRYCKWLQEKTQADNPDFIINIHLPTRWEWIWAAQSLTYTKYTWASNSLRDEKGLYLCNYKHIDESRVVHDSATGKADLKTDTGWIKNGEFYTMPVNSFKPSYFKIYNICGNVAEMIEEKGICMGGSWNNYRGEVTANSAANYYKPSPVVGFRPAIQVKKKDQQSNY